MDVQVRRAVTEGLRVREVDVVTAQQDASAELADSDLLDRAGSLGRVVFTHDKDFLQEATDRQRNGRSFAGVVYAHQLEVTIGQCLHDLEIIAKAAETSDVQDQIIYLPL